ncbi:MAG: ComEC/Rec2 family competence protein [Phycisphaerae bacterium]|nr:ComEC/Rec2 family competence protein [Phycisphaerae bacterium]
MDAGSTATLPSLLDRYRRSGRATIADRLDEVRPAWSDPVAWTLLETMLLGEDRDHPASVVNTERTFASAGLAHLIAISGFNLAILAGSIGWAATVFRVPRLLGEGASIPLLVAYSLIVEPQASVTRSAVCAVGASLGVIMLRRWCTGSVLAIAAIAVLAADPGDILRPGFQLTFAAVLALRHLGPRLHERWYGDRAAPETWLEFLAHATRTMLTTTVAVWLTTTPIAVWHFGRVVPLAVPLSMAAIPIGSLLLLGGYATVGCSLISATLAVPCASGSALLAYVLLHVARVGAMAAPLLPPINASWPWCLATALAGALWCVVQQRRNARIARAFLLIVWLGPLGLAVVSRATAEAPILRVTMMAVGDGSAFLVQSGSSNVLVDAGSSSSTSLARTVVVPCLEAAEVRSLDAVIVTHPDLDHFSAVPSLIAEGRVRELLVTDFFLLAATHDPTGGAGRLVSVAQANGVPITVVAKGLSRRFDRTEWCWLHPSPGFAPQKDNDTSQVICVTARVGDSGDAIRVLFLGDLEARGAIQLGMETDVAAEICELPHHGSWQPAIMPLLARVQPRLVMQSTAATRFGRDRWSGVWGEIGAPYRHVTCRDGAMRLEVTEAGVIRIERWRDQLLGRGWTPAGLVPSRVRTSEGRSALAESQWRPGLALGLLLSARSSADLSQGSGQGPWTSPIPDHRPSGDVETPLAHHRVAPPQSQSMLDPDLRCGSRTPRSIRSMAVGTAPSPARAGRWGQRRSAKFPGRRKVPQRESAESYPKPVLPRGQSMPAQRVAWGPARTRAPPLAGGSEWSFASLNRCQAILMETRRRPARKAGGSAAGLSPSQWSELPEQPCRRRTTCGDPSRARWV